MNRSTDAGWSTRVALATALVAAGGMLALSEPNDDCASAKTSAALSCCANMAKEDGKPTVGFALDHYKIIERQANTFTSNSQQAGALDVDSKGNFLVAWGSRRQEQGNFGIFAQRFDPLGRPLGTEIHVNQFVPNNQEDPAVAFGPDDSAWIAWMSFNQDGYVDGDSNVEYAGHGEIYARRFGTSCCGEFVATGDEFRVNETIRGHQETPAVVVNKDGSALFTWTQNIDNQKSVLARIFKKDGSPATGEFDLSNRDDHGFKNKLAGAAALPDGRFVAAWARMNADGDPVGIIARVINADGTHATNEIRVTGDEPTIAIEPSIDADAAGRFVIAWMSRRDDRGYDVHAHQFAADATPLSSEIIVANENVYWKNGATVAAAPDGRFVISYNVLKPKPAEVEEESSREPADIMARVFSAEGKAITDDAFRVNQFDEGQQMLTVAGNMRRVVWSSLDQIAYAWNGETREGDGSAAALTILAPKTLDVPAPPAVEPIAAAQDVTFDDVIDPRTLIPPVYDPASADTSELIQPADADGFIGFQDTGWTPPDPDLAAGPEHVVVVVNGGIRFYSKEGVMTHSETINQFWAPVGARTFVFDPVAVYDHYSDRFIVGATEHDSNRDYINLAVSDDSDPNGDWYKYRFNVDSIGGFVDYPNLGIGPDAVYVTTDYFSSPTGNVIHIFDKSKMLVGDPVTLKSVKTSSGQRSLGNTNDFDDDNPAHYFITSFSGTGSTLAIDAIVDPLGAATHRQTSVGVPAFSQPPGAEQKGTSALLSTIDYRIKNAVVRNGHLWAVHHIGQNNTARVRWYEIDLKGWPTSGQTPDLVQSGTFDYGQGEHNWMADIGVDTAGNAIIAFSRSSSNDYAYVARATRRVSDPPGEFRSPVTLTVGEGTDSSNRWGDYAGVDEDPLVPGTFWTHNEYAGPGSSNWRTWVGQVEVSGGMLLTVDQVVIGEESNLEITGAEPGQTIYYAYSLRGEGSTPVPFLNTTLDLKKPKLIKTDVADANGDSAISLVIPTKAPVGRPIWFQGAAFESKSNLVELVIEN